MNANIYRHEFRARLRSVLIWSLALTLLTLFFFAMFPVFADQAALMNEMLAKFPRELLVAFGMDEHGSGDRARLLQLHLLLHPALPGDPG